jgi:hypothetical protein
MLRNLLINALRPVLRILSGLIAIPIFRFLLRRIFRVQATDAELERDLENWFRAAVIMLAATSNMEQFIFNWVPGKDWVTFVLRLLLAVGVIESMPDEDVFSILHRGPPKLKLTRRSGWVEAWRRRREVLRGLGILHLRRSSPVFVIMAVVFGDKPGMPHWNVGWWCYGLAITQYLIIALVTQRDRIAGLLEAFEREASAIREDILAAGGGASAVVSDGDADDPNLFGCTPGRYD